MRAISRRLCRRFTSVVCLLAIAAFGCSRDESNRAAVSGKVTFDGKSIEKGTITFFPGENSQGPSSGGTIENGQYSITTAGGPTVGMNRVAIEASRATGKKFADPYSPDEFIDELEQFIPPEYNSETRLEVDIRPGKNVHDFVLGSSNVGGH